ncbi:hypothetical protein U1839_20800 [Sphingomonas sp. RT2P30]|uniref:hypothetical protein n=1 Tax=Parasphingomonas halimpatiens TaxID=3096162 RepID=UPI002FC793AD
MSSDIIVVDEADDWFSAAFVDYAATRGVTAERQRLDAFGRSATIHSAGTRISATPQLPLLLRPIQSGTEHDEVERFARNECFAATWALAVMTPAPVVNRPNCYGWSAAVAFSANLTDQRSGRVAPADEYFWADLPPDAAPDALFHQSLDDWGVHEVLPDGIAARSRRLPPCRGWEQVVVVGDRAFRVTRADIGAADVATPSIAHVRALGLVFATVGWAIPVDGAPIMVRTNPFPGFHEVAPVFTDTADALLAVLAA